MLIQNSSGFIYKNKKKLETFEQALLCLQKTFVGDIGTTKFLTTFFAAFF